MAIRNFAWDTLTMTWVSPASSLNLVNFYTLPQPPKIGVLKTPPLNYDQTVADGATL